MRPMVNPTGKHRAKRRRHGAGTVIRRKPYRLKDGTTRQRKLPWAAVVPYVDASGRRRETWLSAASRPEAEELLARELKKRAVRPQPTEHTVESYVRSWLMTTDLSPAAFDRYRQHAEKRIIPTLGDVLLEDLTPPRVRVAMGKWTGAPATRHGTLIVLRMAMRQAATDRMVDPDAMAGIRAPKVRQAAPTVLDVADARKLLDTVRGDRYAPLLAVSLGLGLRRGEALALRTPDVDLEAETLTVAYSLRRIPTSVRVSADDWWRLQAPKADSGRTIPLPRFVADALAMTIERRDAERKAAKVWAPNDFIFGDVHGNPVSFTTLDHWWKRSLAKAGLPDMRWHQLRASTATMLLAEGVPELTVMAILGHRSLDMTRRYVKLLPRVSRDAADRLEGALG